MNNIKIDSLYWQTEYVNIMDSEIDESKGSFIISTAVADGFITVYREDDKLYGLCDSDIHHFESPITTLRDVLRFFGKTLPDQILFVNMKTYDPYPVEYPLYCTLQSLPSEGIFGIVAPC
jgi:hypothetical protein